MQLTVKYWAVMDKDRKVVAKGHNKYRFLDFLDNTSNHTPIMLYQSAGRAKSAITINPYTVPNKDVEQYLHEEYTRIKGEEPRSRYARFLEKEILEVVEVDVVYNSVEK